MTTKDRVKDLYGRYIAEVAAHIRKTDPVPPDEKLMRFVEEKIHIPEQMADDFRRDVVMKIGLLTLSGKKAKYNSNSKLTEALVLAVNAKT